MKNIVKAYPGKLPFALGLTIFGQILYAAESSSYTVNEVVSLGSLEVGEVSENLFISAEDVNSDGYTDLVLGGLNVPWEPQSDGELGLILLNTGNNTFVVAEGDRPVTVHPREVLTADFDGNGHTDIFIADHGYDTGDFPGFRNELMLNMGDSFVSANDRLPDIPDFSHNAAVGDIDNDGDIDIFVNNNPFNIENELPYFLINDGSAQFALDRQRLPQSVGTVAGDQWSWSAEISDVDNDGFEDLILGRRGDGLSEPSRIYWNDGQGQFSDSQTTYLPDFQNFAANGAYEIIEIFAVDFDRDGDNDLLLSAYDVNFAGMGVQVIRNNSNRVFSDATTACMAGVTQDPDASRQTTFFFRSMDVNFDGLEDIVHFGGGDTSAQRLMISESSNTSKFRAIALGDLTQDSQISSELAFGSMMPVLGANEFGYVNSFGFEENGAFVIGLNYYPVETNNLDPVANLFDSCSSKIHTNLSAGASGDYQLNFEIVQTEPVPIIRADVANAVQLQQLPASNAVFDASTGTLTLPELVIDGEVAYTNLQFQLIDEAQFLFQLSGSD